MPSTIFAATHFLSRNLFSSTLVDALQRDSLAYFHVNLLFSGNRKKERKMTFSKQLFSLFLLACSRLWLRPRRRWKSRWKKSKASEGRRIYFVSSSNAQLISHNPFRNRLFPLKACHRLVLELYISNAPQSVRVSNEKNSSILRFTSWSSNTTFFQCFLSVPGLKVTP